MEEEALRYIAKRAIERKTGARGLRAILEKIMLNVMFDIPSRDDVEKCIITKETVINNSDPILILSEGQRGRKTIKRQRTRENQYPNGAWQGSFLCGFLSNIKQDKNHLITA